MEMEMWKTKMCMLPSFHHGLHSEYATQYYCIAVGPHYVTRMSQSNAIRRII
ncbi:hypothetical protein AZE42_10508 [Rhizopogon vesiculosus]|uniref:Uncharacterized protein n=1 Tax=Rhizopogon vesiculosus TaxID=180088 RepID=A0A1J8QKW6_9AGAM|nr:hypothetical protein AZE42_10508 [Rhizopogon vesiculosus]